MNEKISQSIENFFSYLSAVNELHHPNDEKRLYNIALEAVRFGEVIPRYEMQQVFEKQLKEQNLENRRTEFEIYFQQYISILERTYEILKQLNKVIEIPKTFYFK